jgi:hypothetical protein
MKNETKGIVLKSDFNENDVNLLSILYTNDTKDNDHWIQGSLVQTWLKTVDFKGDKNPQHVFLRRRSKAFSPMSQDFTAVKEPCGV